MDALLANPPKPPRSCPDGNSLWLLGQNLNDQCAEVLAHALQRGDYRHLKYLTLGNNAISTRGMCAIAGSIGQGALPCLTSLSVASNPILDEGLVALCAVIDKMPSITCLELMECGFGDTGGQALAAAAKAGRLRSLSSAYMRDNQIGDVGMASLCEAFAAGGLPRAETLHFNNNKIGDEGCLALADAIEAGHLDGVRLIQMCGNKQSRDGFEVVMDVIKEYEKTLKVYF